MKVGLSADIHLTHSTTEGSHSRQELTSHLILKSIQNYVLQEKPDLFVVAGDLFEHHGVIGTRIGIAVKKLFRELNRQTGTRFVIIAGNHDYGDFSTESFGKSSVNLLLGEMRDSGIFAVCEKGEVLFFDPKTSVMETQESNQPSRGIAIICMPYRRNSELFHESVAEPLRSEISKIDHDKYEVMSVWHAGIPFGENIWAGDEPENDFASFQNDFIQEVLSITESNRIFLGHYHKPATETLGGFKKKHDYQGIPLPDSAALQYIGSMTTNSRAESSQRKHILSWNSGGKIEAWDTKLNLHFKGTMDEVESHVKNMVDGHGDSVRQLLRVEVVPENEEEYTIDRYNSYIERCGSLGVPEPLIQKPKQSKISKIEDLIEKHGIDGEARELLEKEVAFRAAELEQFSERDIELLTELFETIELR
jgi:DNA repair exonuclease SbcCD nuclease subunit